ncbi:DUF4145 domain-containing protein [Mesorhizobium sp. ANAO-SY3R2]|uniref:DUF4145 domain-containing protein n=1 Tax=Mesorhizobium sp. ANAO-SY3R2 TaxID=3166644 RepID=UPI00366FBCB9
MSSKLNETNSLVKYTGYVNDFMTLQGYVTLKDSDPKPAPEFIPEEIAAAFLEATTCVSVRCWNAAGAMFRSAIDLATKSLLPSDGEPAIRVRRSLGLRLEWLFDNGRLPADLRQLADAVQQDGNDGVHDASLTEHDALDLLDFTYELLERIYTEPGKIEAAKKRREARRDQARG